jgi:antitoxin (DNA-binding transcriptional repressor) of toxin-antitoxin stability system
MRAIGIRELKSRLSEYVRLARSGEVVLVTDRGRVAAELHPPGAAAARAGAADPMAELAHRGLATPGAPHDPALYAPRPSALRASSVRDLLAAERAEGRE